MQTFRPLLVPRRAHLPYQGGAREDQSQTRCPLIRGRVPVRVGVCIRQDRKNLFYSKHNMMTNKKYVFYDWSNKDYAKANRKNMTKYEWLVRHTILKQKKTWYKRVRQKMIGSYICDFYCSELLLCIEIDGKYHNHTQKIWSHQRDVYEEKMNQDY